MNKKPKPERQLPEKAIERPPRDKMVRGSQETRKDLPRRGLPRSKPHG